MNNSAVNKIVGAILILSASLLYLTDKICFYLLTISTVNTGKYFEIGSVESWLTVVMSAVSLLIGIYLLIKKTKV